MKKKWMIYGASGYTGELIAHEAVKRGFSPVLGGRSEENLLPLAIKLKLEVREFPLDAGASAFLEDIDLVLHCAGPFSNTSAPMVEACIAAASHYLDITGEIAVFEHTQSKNLIAKERGIVLCSGVGFDVIPTDCIALKLKELLPDATHLSLGFDSDSGISPGTMKTMIQGLGGGSAERRDGALTPVPLGSQRRTIDFGRGLRSAMGIPWGDVSTAFHTTGIPNISAWIPMAKSRILGARLLAGIGPVLATSFMQNKLKDWVDRNIAGPDETLRSNAPAFVWGEARNAAGQIKTVRIQTANVYDLTVNGSLAVVEKLLKSEYKGGSFTPASLFGSHFIEELPGSSKFQID
ncbi:saccharopine dehydrogenase NADP-binding domain-containing protein [Planococcus sp. N028]|uniref:Saccharopine dehydrogenase NADP-binding domain-containing protein n=1 Tax=Planococcus shixiaomingii TaxID=3058393 RepID=A0ABT8N5W1_9BACL|nr:MULTISPECIES: saccharopine dehydrogenase NADP-binding domain-containing protein [unclassified Planococcus (in: firmicutes)]MDN7243124.1 saccharopine dehydrogenase NADP-binding domain-containing protein [Planococcus sp. N028]WKA55069.1 saccharopine dehydrogenase NADP-binding domain-containing protein [Planococcus sp. N022]